MTGPAPLRHIGLVLPLLSFGAGAADAFAFLALGGIFTANMTGNAVLAAMFSRAGYMQVLVGALAAIVAFALALLLGFRMTRGAADSGRNEAAMLTALAGSTACHAVIVALWWALPHAPATLLALIMASSAAMALQTVAAKRDRVNRGSTTTYLTGTLTDLMQDIAERATSWATWRWLPILALPLGAAVATAIIPVAPMLTPLLPLVATITCMAILAGPMSAAGAKGQQQA